MASHCGDGKAKLRVGVAVGEQVTEAKTMLRAATKHAGLAIAYLVPLDGA
jgi:hypothetical protein